MPKVTYIEYSGTEHPVEVPVGLSVMRGAVIFDVGDLGHADPHPVTAGPN